MLVAFLWPIQQDVASESLKMESQSWMRKLSGLFGFTGKLPGKIIPNVVFHTGLKRQSLNSHLPTASTQQHLIKGLRLQKAGKLDPVDPDFHALEPRDPIAHRKLRMVSWNLNTFHIGGDDTPPCSSCDVRWARIPRDGFSGLLWRSFRLG